MWSWQHVSLIYRTCEMQICLNNTDIKSQMSSEGFKSHHSSSDRKLNTLRVKSTFHLTDLFARTFNLLFNPFLPLPSPRPVDLQPHLFALLYARSRLVSRRAGGLSSYTQRLVKKIIMVEKVRGEGWRWGLLHSLISCGWPGSRACTGSFPSAGAWLNSTWSLWRG